MSASFAIPENYIEEVASRFTMDFSDEDQLAACHTMLKFLSSTPPRQSSKLSFGAINNIISRELEKNISSNLVETIISYFMGGRVGLLDVTFYYHDFDGEEVYLIDRDVIQRAGKTGVFYHPRITDTPVENYEKHIEVAFKPSLLAEAVYAKISGASNG